MLHQAFKRLFPLGALCAGVVACNSAEQTEDGIQVDSAAKARAADTSAKSAGSPFYFREAKLPKGFPQPGPLDEVIIKDYPSYRMALVEAKQPDGAEMDSLFRPLFNHISREDIAMTAPVEMTYSMPRGASEQAAPSDGGRSTKSAGAAPTTQPFRDLREVVPDGRRGMASMAFLYADPEMGRLGPDATDARVVVRDVPAVTVLSISVRGGYQARKVREALDRIQSWIEQNPGEVRIVGEPRYLGYNSPFVPSFLQMSEVQVPIERIKTAEAASVERAEAARAGLPASN